MSNNNKIKNDQSMEPINPQSSIIINTEINTIIHLIIQNSNVFNLFSNKPKIICII